MQERRSREEDERDDRDQHRDRTAHHGRGDGVPPTTAGLIGLEDRDPQPVNASSEQGEERRKER